MTRDRDRDLDIRSTGVFDRAFVTDWGGVRVISGSMVNLNYRDETLLRLNLNSSDRDYWQSVRRFLSWLGAPFPRGEAWARAAYKTLRAGRHEAQAKSWGDVLAPGIARWAAGEIDRASKGCDCVDNARCAQLGNTGQMRRYRRQKERGCCGSQDWEALGPDGKVYALGFNHGH